MRGIKDAARAMWASRIDDGGVTTLGPFSFRDPSRVSIQEPMC